MGEKSDTEFREKIAAILKGKELHEDYVVVGPPLGTEDYVVVGPALLTDDDREALEAIKTVYDKHLNIMLSPLQSAFRPNEILLERMGFSRNAIVKKCLLLAKFQNLIQEVLGHKTLSNLSESDARGVLASLWIYDTVCHGRRWSHPADECIKQTSVMAPLPCPMKAILSSMEDFGQLILDEDELRFYPIQLIGTWLCEYCRADRDFIARHLLIRNAISTYEKSIYPMKKDRFKSISHQFHPIFNLSIISEFPNYLWAFLDGNKLPDNLEDSDYSILFSIFFCY